MLPSGVSVRFIFPVCKAAGSHSFTWKQTQKHTLPQLTQIDIQFSNTPDVWICNYDNTPTESVIFFLRREK